MCSVAEKLDLDYEQDKFWNVIVRKPASKGYEDAPVVMLEGHMDMVCAKTPESTHDFSHDPIEIYVDDKGDIRAKDTTLGADDGYGVAYMLAVMEENFPHPPLELVFTVREENGCNGVDALDAGKLKSRRMIGLERDGRDGGIHKLRFLLYERPDETDENVRDGACAMTPGNTSRTPTCAA